MSTEMAATDSATSLGAESTVVDETVTSSSLPGKSGSNAYSVLGDIVTFYNYYTSLIPWLATFCNGLSFLVFAYKLKHSRGERSVNLVLMGLAIADILSLTTAMDFSYYFWNDHKFSPMQSTDFGCRLITYVNDIARDCSSYFVLIFTLDRFISVKFPFKKQLWVNGRRVLLAMLTIFACAALAEMYQPYFLMHYEPVDRCYTLEPDKYNLLNSIIRNTLGFVLPGILVALLNFLIIRVLGKFSKKRIAMTGVAEKQTRSLTILLLSISTFSFLVGLPKAIFMYYTQYGIDVTKPQSDGYWSFAFLSDALNMLNHTCNFFFYCLSGSQFRKELKVILIRVFTCGKRGREPLRATMIARTRSSMVSQKTQAPMQMETMSHSGELNGNSETKTASKS